MQIPVIKEGEVINVIELEAEHNYVCDEGCTLGTEGGHIGDLWDGENYTHEVDIHIADEDDTPEPDDIVVISEDE